MGSRELDAQIAHEVMCLENVRFDAANSVAYFDVAGYPNVRRYSDSMDAAWQMEEEIERRGLRYAYVMFLTDLVKATTAWEIIHATPEQRCMAALEAVSSASQTRVREK